MRSSKTKNTYDLLCYSVVVVMYCIVVRCNMLERVEMCFWRAYREKLGINWIQIFVFVFIAFVTHTYSLYSRRESLFALTKPIQQ